jgi:hypothetical protein
VLKQLAQRNLAAINPLVEAHWPGQSRSGEAPHGIQLRSARNFWPTGYVNSGREKSALHLKMVHADKISECWHSAVRTVAHSTFGSLR